MTSLPNKAIKSKIQIGDIQLEVFKRGEKEFFLSQTQAANSVKKDESSIRRFMSSKYLKSLLGKDSASGDKDKVEVEGVGYGFISVVTPDICKLYWIKELEQGNEYARALIVALMTETLESKCLTAFDLIVDQKELDEKVKAEYRLSLFGGGNLNNDDYVLLCQECREDHEECILGF